MSYSYYACNCIWQTHISLSLTLHDVHTVSVSIMKALGFLLETLRMIQLHACANEKGHTIDHSLSAVMHG